MTPARGPVDWENLGPRAKKGADEVTGALEDK